MTHELCPYQSAGGYYECPQCHDRRPRIVQRNCPAATPPGPPGPGYFLARRLRGLRWLKPGKCDCELHAEQMDRWGPAGCRRELATIVGWLVDGWIGYVPGSHDLATLYVTEAIEEAEQAAEAWKRSLEISKQCRPAWLPPAATEAGR